MQTLLSRPELRARLRELGLEATPDYPPARYAPYVKAEVEKWAAVIKAGGIKAP